MANNEDRDQSDPLTLKRQSQLLSSALSSAGYFKSHFCTLFACMQKKVWKVCKNIQQTT